MFRLFFTGVNVEVVSSLLYAILYVVDITTICCHSHVSKFQSTLGNTYWFGEKRIFETLEERKNYRR